MKVNFHGAINRDLTTLQMSDLTSVCYIAFGEGDQKAANSRFARGRERDDLFLGNVTTRVFVYIHMIPLCLSCKTIQIMINILTQQLARYPSDIVQKAGMEFSAKEKLRGTIHCTQAP